MKMKELLYKRILIAEKGGYSTSSTVTEVKILEVSPSGKWVKIQNMNGNKFWRISADVIPIEILGEIETPPVTNPEMPF
jgi:hypothetical protein